MVRKSGESGESGEIEKWRNFWSKVEKFIYMIYQGRPAHQAVTEICNSSLSWYLQRFLAWNHSTLVQDISPRLAGTAMSSSPCYRAKCQCPVLWPEHKREDRQITFPMNWQHGMLLAGKDTCSFPSLSVTMVMKFGTWQDGSEFQNASWVQSESVSEKNRTPIASLKIGANSIETPSQQFATARKSAFDVWRPTENL